jgi:hypothetical protein
MIEILALAWMCFVLVASAAYLRDGTRPPLPPVPNPEADELRQLLVDLDEGVADCSIRKATRFYELAARVQRARLEAEEIHHG